MAICSLVGLGGAEASAAALAPGEPLTAAFAEALLGNALHGAEPEARFDLIIEHPRLPLANPGDEVIDLEVEGLAYDPAGGRFRATLVGAVDGVERFRLPTHGRAHALVELPVLARPIGAGERISAADLDWLVVRPNRLRAASLTEPEQLIGAEARRRLAAGRPLSERDVAAPRLVRRGHPVRLVFHAPRLQLSALGTAEEDGALGAPVRVMNRDSQRRLQGLVTGPDEVTIEATGTAPFAYR